MLLSALTVQGPTLNDVENTKANSNSVSSYLEVRGQTWNILDLLHIPNHTEKESQVNIKFLTCVQFFATPRTIQSLEFSRPEYWSRYPFPFPGDLPNTGIEHRSPALQADSLSTKPPGKPKNTGMGNLSLLQISPTRESNQGLLHCRQILCQLSYQGNPTDNHPSAGH